MKLEGGYPIPDNFPDDLLSRKASLDPLGIPDHAWSRMDAIKACELLAEAGFAILGGDVFVLTERGARPALDNWHCDPTLEEEKSTEAWQSYISRARTAAKQYIMAYPENPGHRFVYGIVWTSWKPE